MISESGARPSRPGLLARHAVPLSLALLAIAAMVGGRELRLWLRFDREAILHGEVWRLVTAHFAHLGWSHLAMNLAGLALIWLLFHRVYTTGQWLAALAVSMLGVGAGVLAFLPAVHWYVGLSGVLHGLFVAGALASLAAGYRAELLLLGLLVVKLAWEQVHGALPGSEGFAGGTVLVESHLFGAIAGLFAAAVLLAYRRRSGKTRP
jgi:rhomboid family GlyGly-CTERM serine protease